MIHQVCTKRHNHLLYVTLSPVLGNVYVADKDNYRIRKVTVSTDTISTIAGTGSAGFGGDGGDATSATLYYACGVTIDSSGNVYIADAYNNRVRKVTVGYTYSPR